MVKVNGSSNAAPVVAPIPGSTPMITPMIVVVKISKRRKGSKITELIA